MDAISAEDIERFDTDGFLIVERLIDAATVAGLRAAFDRLFRGEFETGVTPDEVNWQAGTGDPTLTRQICNGWRADRTVARTLLDPDFGRAVARLAGWSGTRMMIDNVLWKPPGARPLGYHQDSAYLDWIAPSDLTSLWLALDETRADGGTLEYVRGSHRWRRRPPEGEFHGPSDYARPMHGAAAAEGIAPEIVPVEVPAGGGSFHHGWLWHGSGVNRTAAERRALVLHAMRAEARFNPAGLRLGTGPIYSRYKRLADDTMEESYFPIIWREDGYCTPGIDGFLDGAGE